MTGPLEMLGDDAAAVCVDGVCAVPTTTAPSERSAQDGADDAGLQRTGSPREDGVSREA
ncbi:hypothetical protein [Aeromicrobium sp. CnD17-E]|uniref:hypothetical protein n=1 Tax=Aeromicrobium sp. CnD17-E TaxID=2954487 RepID=UPI0020970294|nr:hypothetical protein [Aeromicrobium sp. CnD17-E]MCO7239301.1 hypothetical protein [Aeromicrobium sp. CnD17-E]